MAPQREGLSGLALWGNATFALTELSEVRRIRYMRTSPLRDSKKFSKPKEGFPQNLAVPLDPISVGTNKRRHALLDPSAVSQHALGGQGLDARRGRSDTSSQ